MYDVHFKFLTFFFMVSNMYDQCSHCFKMYRVNINTSYEIADFGLCRARDGAVSEPRLVREFARTGWEGFSLGEGCGDPGLCV